MAEAFADTKTGEVTHAIKDSKDAHGNPIKNGDVIGIADGSIECVGSSLEDVVLDLLEVMEADDADTATILAGADYSDEELEALVARIEETYEDLEVEFLLTDEPRDSMVICTPYVGDEHAFYYNRKIIGMKARGGYRVGDEFYEFDTQESLGLLDWGRGVWTYDNVWYWAAAQGIQDGHVVGLNLGYGFGDTSAATENMVFFDGIASKLGDVDFGIPTLPDGTYDYLSPWHMTDDEGRLDLSFAPEIDRRDYINVGGVVRSDQHQVFGKLNGYVVLDDGARIDLTDLRASAEHIHNRY
jgi:hypothetical protein